MQLASNRWSSSSVLSHCPRSWRAWTELPVLRSFRPQDTFPILILYTCSWCSNHSGYKLTPKLHPATCRWSCQSLPCIYLTCTINSSRHCRSSRPALRRYIHSLQKFSCISFTEILQWSFTPRSFLLATALSRPATRATHLFSTHNRYCHYVLSRGLPV